MKNADAPEVTTVYNHSKLKGRIKEKCNTQGEYAKKIGRGKLFAASEIEEYIRATECN